jgi:hypothetical protein
MDQGFLSPSFKNSIFGRAGSPLPASLIFQTSNPNAGGLIEAALPNPYPNPSFHLPPAPFHQPPPRPLRLCGRPDFTAETLSFFPNFEFRIPQ